MRLDRKKPQIPKPIREGLSKACLIRLRKARNGYVLKVQPVFGVELRTSASYFLKNVCRAPWRNLDVVNIAGCTRQAIKKRDYEPPEAVNLNWA